VEFRCDSLGQAEVDLADRCWVLSGDFDERAAGEHEFGSGRIRDSNRAKATRHQVVFEKPHSAAPLRHPLGTALPGTASHLSRTFVCADAFAQECCQHLVGTLGSPRPTNLWFELVEQAGTARAVTHLGLFENQARRLQNGEVLAHGVVIETYEVGELRHSDEALGACDVKKESVTGGISESPGLSLEVAPPGLPPLFV
jgi:hypothetical protein